MEGNDFSPFFPSKKKEQGTENIGLLICQLLSLPQTGSKNTG